METITEAEQRHARALAEEYRSKGYEVTVGPSVEQLPDFLSGYQPDLLIRKGQEATVVEVKSRSSLAKNPRIRELARLLQTKPGWNFELVVVSERKELDIPERTCPLTKEEILQRVKTATKLLDSGNVEAALLLAWPSVEAAVRMLTEQEGIVLDRLTPLYILKQAVINGVISREDYNLLMHAMKYRNALAHGFKATDLDSTLPRQLIDAAERLLQSEVTPAS